MSFIKVTEFDKKYLTAPIQRVTTIPKKLVPTNVFLPLNSVIHFIGDSDQLIGIDNSYCLLRNVKVPVFTHHELELIKTLGNVTPTHFNALIMIRRYHKTHLNIKPLTNLDRSLSNNPVPIIINYSLLNKMYKYNTNNLIVYQEWYNIRATMWTKINAIGDRREQFIRYQLPEVLPTKMDLAKYAKEFKASGLGEFHSTNAFDILELWRMMSPDADTSTGVYLSEEAREHVRLVFVESGIMVIIKLSDLLEWSVEDHDAAITGFYRFLDSLIGLRNSLDVTSDTTEVVTESTIIGIHDAIIKLIEERGSVGALSAAEQKALLKLAVKHKTVLDPHGSGKTLDQMVVTANDLKVDNQPIMADSKVIHDKSFLYSSVQNMDKNYLENGLHKDIIQTILMLHPAGVIVKDIKVNSKINAVTKADNYHVSVQPINGPASTITFTLPIVDPDGTFTAGGIRYRMDTQKGELPILKTKMDMVSLTSYYGKIFVTRNDSVAVNFSKWITKELINRNNNPDDHKVSGLLYGMNNPKGKKFPRVYTAICATINSFNIGDYHLIFNVNKIPEKLNENEINSLIKRELIPCGIVINGTGILGMDGDGLIHNVIPDNPIMKESGLSVMLGSIPFLIDPDLGEGPIEYTEMSLLNRRIPIILALCYMYGLDKALEKIGASFILSPTNVRVATNPNQYKLKFKDIVYLIDISNKYHRLLIGGFNAIRNDSVKYRGSDFNKQTVYGTLLAGLKLTNYHMRELKLMWDMFVEPITLGILREMGEPTEFYDILLKANELLIDDFIPDINGTRYKGYERLCGMMYHELITAMRQHRAQGAMSNVGVTMHPNSVWLNVLQDQSIALVEESNPIQNLKEKESFTHSGAGGRSAVTMVKDTRGYSEKDLGVISEATPDSAKVGIRAYLTANPNLTSARGVTREYNKEIDGSSKVLSTTALLGSALIHDDAKRVTSL